MTAKSLVLPVLLLCLSLDYAQPTRVRDEHPWDLLIFTQQWPATVCKEWKEQNPDHKCSMPQDAYSWTIHGIWPTKLGTIGPSFCNKTWHFDPEQIRPIETPLITFWTNIEADTSTYGLWSHEWNKHGTCAAVLEPLNSELKYFTKGLEWIQKFSMSNILKEADIIPSNEKEYPIIDIHNAVNSKLGVNPAIECRKENGKSWLVEIRICFNKTLDLTDCDGILNMQPKDILEEGDMLIPVLTNCDRSQGVIYHDPVIPVSTLYIQLYKLISWLQWFTM